MSDTDGTDISPLAERVKERLSATGKSARKASLNAGLSEAFIRNILEGKSSSPRADNLVKLAAELGTTAEWLLYGANESAPVKDRGSLIPRGPAVQTGLTKRVEMAAAPIPVLGRVAAGLWLEIDPFAPFGEPLFSIPVPADGRYPQGSLYGLEVDGTSLNKIARSGDILVCVDIASLGIEPAEGDLVVVERLRGQGSLREVTAKRFRREGKRVELWPESDDPRFQDPIVFDGEPDDDIEVRIIARVEWIFRKP